MSCDPYSTTVSRGLSRSHFVLVGDPPPGEMVSRNLRLSTFGGIYLANRSSILAINFSESGAAHTTAGLIAFPLQAIPTGSLTLELFT